MNNTELDTLETLLAKAAPPPWFVSRHVLSNGLSLIEDGRQEGMFPLKGEMHEIALTAAAVTALPRLIAIARNAEAIRDLLLDGTLSKTGSEVIFDANSPESANALMDALLGTLNHA